MGDLAEASAPERTGAPTSATRAPATLVPPRQPAGPLSLLIAYRRWRNEMTM